MRGAGRGGVVRGEVAQQVVQVVNVLLDGLLRVGGGVVAAVDLLGAAAVLVPLAGAVGGRGLGHRPHLGDAREVAHEAV